MDFVNCMAKCPSKSCYDREAAIDSKLETSCDHIYTNLIEYKNKGINLEDPVKSMVTPCTNKRSDDSRKKRVSCNDFAHQSSSISVHKTNNKVEMNSRDSMYFLDKLPYNVNPQCPRCGQRMEEPRLLPCLHPICLACVYELISKPTNVSSRDGIRDNDRMYNINETCPLCDSLLPNANCTVPPPHYPLQHRLVMDTMRHKLVNRILCDICTGQVLALVQCSTCLRNFCLECGKQHEQQGLVEARAIKHLMRPLWEATKVRRTILCQIHPMHALRFYCIACQQVTCKECMWSMHHRGHASEDAVKVGKRAAAYLATMLQKARTRVNNLLIQYNHDVFANDDLEEAYDVAKICRYVR